MVTAHTATASSSLVDYEPAESLTLHWALNRVGSIKLGTADPTDNKTVAIRVSLWETASAARTAYREDSETGRDRLIWEGSTVAFRIMPTLAPKVTKLADVTASVVNDFRRFTANGSTGTTATMGTLASFDMGFADSRRVSVTSMATGTRTVTREILTPAGVQVTYSDVVDKAEVEITGNNGVASYNFGNFHLNAGTTTAPNCTGTGAAVLTRERSDDATVNLANTETLTTDVTAAGARIFCANVTPNTARQTKSPMYQRIEEVDYRLSLTLTYEGITAPRTPLVNAAAGTIVRDGTEVRIAYLTTATEFTGLAGRSDGYNQRLVISNYGSGDIGYTLEEFATEPNVMVEAKSGEFRGSTWTVCEDSTDDTPCVAGTVSANGTAVIPVARLISIVGGSRAGAKLIVESPDADISVATTQVTLPEGQTDTVRLWPE